MKVKVLLALMVMAAVAMFVFAGCSKDEPAAQGTSEHGHEHGADGEHEHAETAKYANTKCPIMGSVIKPEKITEDLIKEYKGQKVAFCCGGCPEKWAALSDEDKATKLLASK